MIIVSYINMGMKCKQKKESEVSLPMPTKKYKSITLKNAQYKHDYKKNRKE